VTQALDALGEFDFSCRSLLIKGSLRLINLTNGACMPTHSERLGLTEAWLTLRRLWSFSEAPDVLQWPCLGGRRVTSDAGVLPWPSNKVHLGRGAVCRVDPDQRDICRRENHELGIHAPASMIAPCASHVPYLPIGCTHTARPARALGPHYPAPQHTPRARSQQACLWECTVWEQQPTSWAAAPPSSLQPCSSGAAA
jgi:hypothetical protein